MSALPEVEVVVDGAAHRGFKSADVSLSIERIAGAFSVVATDTWMEGGQRQRRSFAPGQAAQVRVGGDPAIRGFIDATSPQYDGNSYTVRITGRDASGDLVDSAAIHPGGEWLDAPLERIARDLLKPFGMPVRVSDAGRLFERFAIEPGESVYEALERAARLRQLLVTSDGRGGIVIGKPGQGPNLGALDRRSVLSASADFSDANRASEIIVRATREGDIDDVDPEDLAYVVGRARDPGIKRYRPRIVIAEQAVPGITLDDRAEWEVRVRAGRGRKFDVVVDSWSNAAGQKWVPNGTLDYSDDWLGADGRFLISNVTYSQADTARTARLSLLPPYAFDTLVPKGEDDDIGWGREKRDPTQRAAWRNPTPDRGAQR